jgi:hypothetical protein
MHAPRRQCCFGAQAMPHPPQSVLLVSVLTHAPEQYEPEAHLQTPL